MQYHLTFALLKLSSIIFRKIHLHLKFKAISILIIPSITYWVASLKLLKSFTQLSKRRFQRYLILLAIVFLQATWFVSAIPLTYDVSYKIMVEIINNSLLWFQTLVNPIEQQWFNIVQWIYGLEVSVTIMFFIC